MIDWKAMAHHQRYLRKQSEALEITLKRQLWDQQDRRVRLADENGRLQRALSDIQFDLINCPEAASSQSCEHLKDAIRIVNAALAGLPPPS